MRRKDAGFHQPFSKLKVGTKKRVSEPDKPDVAHNSSSDSQKSARGPERDDDTLFAEAMNGVEIVPGTNRVVAKREPTLQRVINDDAEVEAALADLVDGSGEFDLADTSEYIEGASHGIDAHLLRRLRAGDYAIQSTLDLHGLTRDEARKAVAIFIDRERAAHRRSVLIIHGRGLHSKDHIPVLKDEVKVWLARGRTGRAVLAFCTARPSDGGVGALYVLLRKLR